MIFHVCDNDTLGTHLPFHAHSKNQQLGNDHDGETDVKSKEEDIAVLQPMESGGRPSAKALQVMHVEVSTSIFLSFLDLTACLLASCMAWVIYCYKLSR